LILKLYNRPPDQSLNLPKATIKVINNYYCLTSFKRHRTLLVAATNPFHAEEDFVGKHNLSFKLFTFWTLKKTVFSHVIFNDLQTVEAPKAAVL
jgi:hypothetical protein